MNKPFVILLLSDTHIGKPNDKWDSLRVFDSLMRDLKTVSDEHSLNPNLLIFGGDLAFGELSSISLQKQYELAKEFLQNVQSQFDSPPRIFLVPGNHDLNRKAVDKGQKLLRDTFTISEVDQMMTENDVTFKRFLERQKEWREFAKEIAKENRFNLNEDFNFVTGLIDFNNIPIGLAGLNSAWAAFGENEEAKLWIGKHQFERAYDEIKEAQFKIAVSHHPLDWLNTSEKAQFIPWIETDFDIFLHGHEHRGWFHDQEKHLIVSAGASYDRSDKPNGYAWIVIDFDKKEAEIYLREYESSVHRWKARNIPGKTDPNGKATIKNLFERNKSKELAKVAHPTHSKEQPETLEEFLGFLSKRPYFFKWEKPISDIKNPTIFWAVRLRKPTPIHAVQSFVAAALQKFGCNVVLCLDDLGRVEYPADAFFGKINQLFDKVGGNHHRLERRQISEFLSDPTKSGQVWQTVHKWLGKNEVHSVEKVLDISKVIELGDVLELKNGENTDSKVVTVATLNSKKPRRILTPSMVWAGFSIVVNEKPDQTVITLGGLDEEMLWDAWKECIGEYNTHTGHLYTPILEDEKGQPIHMDKVDISWKTASDVRKTIRNEFNIGDWDKSHRLIPWCFNLFSSLPRAISETDPPLKINGHEIYSFNEFVDLGLDEADAIEHLTEEFSLWLV